MVKRHPRHPQKAATLAVDEPIPTVALCMIVGNEAAVIERCLNAFSGAFDELCIVRAIGSLEPDNTLDLADAWCTAHGKEIFSFEYKNAPECAGWPHVDDFAAARNLAFKLAQADWIFWADADDITKPGGNFGAELLKLTLDDSVDAYLLPYEVPGTAKAPQRERLFRRSINPRWKFPVHENVMVDPAKHSIRAMPAPVWLHAPLAAKPRGSERNLKILGQSLKDAGTQLYYVHQEHFYAKSYQQARHWGEVTLRMHGLHPSFKYECLLNLGRMEKNKIEAMDLFARAHATLPHCREALAHMATTALELGDLHRADDLSEQMLRLREPDTDRRPWCHEAKWYHWAGLDLRARILRMLDRPDDAECLLEAKTEPPLISLIHASRGRNQQAWDCRERWLSDAIDASRVEHILCVDADDGPAVAFAKQFNHVVLDAGHGPVSAWNAGALKAQGEILVQLSDDWTPCYGWDQLLIDAIGDLESEAVVAVSDGHRTDDLLCIAICTRKRWCRQDYQLFAPEYFSMYSDNEFSYRAWRDGVVIDKRNEILFTHHHPAFNAGQWDATYQHTNDRQHYHAGRQTFQRRNPEAPPHWSGNLADNAG